MKRFFALVCLLIFMMTSLSASAEWELPVFNEDFSIRNGIAFGMSKNDVLTVEENNGNAPDYNEANHIGYKNVRFLGKSNTWLYHFFTREDKLSSFAYSRMEDSHTFADLYETLAGKYGEPMLTTELSLFSTAIWYEIPFVVFNLREKWSADTLSGGASPSSSSGDLWISDYAVWLVKYNDCAVVIELAESNKGEGLSLGYAGISHEDMNAWLEYREKENIETENSYANDI